MSGINPFPWQVPPPQTPITDKDGAFTKDGRYFLIALWSRTGHGDGVPTVAPGLTVLAGATFNIVSDWNQFTSVGALGVALLPPLVVGTDCIIINDDGANALGVDAQPGVSIDAGGRYNLAAAKMQWFRCITPTLIKSMQLG